MNSKAFGVAAAITVLTLGMSVPTFAQSTVTWTNLVNATATGGALQKSGGCDGCSDAGAVSQQQIATGTGYMEFTPAVTTARFQVGLGNGVGTPPAINQFSYSFSLWPGGGLTILESGSYHEGTQATFMAGDVLRIAIEAGPVVKYYKNGTSIYTSTVAPSTYPYAMGATLLGAASHLSSATISSGSSTFTWTNVVNATATGSALQKSGGCSGCQDAGAISQQQIAGGTAFVDIVPGTTTRYEAGLGNSFGTPPIIDQYKYAIEFWPSGGVSIRESTVYHDGTTYVPGDTFRIAIEAGPVVKYYKNGTPFYDSTAPPNNYPYVLGATLLDSGSRISSVTMTSGTSGGGDFYQSISDRVVRPKPILPTLGAAGTTITDPTFNNRILRVTDASLASNGSWSSLGGNGNTQAWNLAGTRFVIAAASGGARTYDFNRSTFAISSPADLTFLASAGMTFSCLTEDTLIGISSSHAEPTLKKYVVGAGYTTIVGVNTLVPGADPGDPNRTYASAVTTADVAGTEYFAFQFGGVDQDHSHYVVRAPLNNPTGGKVLDTVASTINGNALPGGYTLGLYIHSTSMDRTGRYVMLGPTQAVDGPRGPATSNPANIVWDTQTDTFIEARAGVPGEWGGHGALGYGVAINMPDNAGDARDTRYRVLSDPLTTFQLIDPFPTPHDIEQDMHSSWSNSIAGTLKPIIGAPFRRDVPFGNGTPSGVAWREWDDEIIAIRTDPQLPTKVWRFAHHRSDLVTHSGYYWFGSTPRPNVDSQGRFAVFTSNWELSLGNEPDGLKRTDVFLVELR